MQKKSAAGAGWYLPPYGDCVWPGAWTRDPEQELDALGCDAEARQKLVLGGSAAAWYGDAGYFDEATWAGLMGVAERLWVGSPTSGGVAANVTAALPRLAIQSCRMRMRGFSVSSYQPSTTTMAGVEHWCTGGTSYVGKQPVHGDAYNGNECFVCPAAWELG
jgi:hypothetical protein